ncbi:hypothetical protein [Taibaiella koreensis]|uniref:hypothetical protein n=1 Tax=Taibaiella koreensis TaxID=1268548 RepID=UPI0013C37BF0|nr:hypothetical protein [Taibaiella koreensis]
MENNIHELKVGNSNGCLCLATKESRSVAHYMEQITWISKPNRLFCGLVYLPGQSTPAATWIQFPLLTLLMVHLPLERVRLRRKYYNQESDKDHEKSEKAYEKKVHASIPMADCLMLLSAYSRS